MSVEWGKEASILVIRVRIGVSEDTHGGREAVGGHQKQKQQEDELAVLVLLFIAVLRLPSLSSFLS